MQFTVKERKIKCENTQLIGDNADYIAEFSFDAEWTGKVKTARFIMNGQFKDVLLSNDRCTIPVEVLKQGFLQVGVFSTEMTTTHCEAYISPSVKEKNGSPVAPAYDVYAQIIRMIENIHPEVPVSEVEGIVADYLEAHPVETISEDDVNAIIEQYLIDHPIETITEDEVNQLIADYMEEHPTDIYNDIKNPRKYRVGLISDVHCDYSDGANDFARALATFKKLGCDFVCFCGDAQSQSSDTGTTNGWTKYVEKLTASDWTPSEDYFACRGNHDVFIEDTRWVATHGTQPNHYFIKGDFAFVFLSLAEDVTNDGVWSGGNYSLAITFLQNIMPSISGKKIMLFVHYPFYGKAGVQTGRNYGFNSNDTRSTAILNAVNGEEVIIFGGHSHLPFEAVSYQSNLNIHKENDKLTFVHIPAPHQARLYDYDSSTNQTAIDNAVSEGWVMDMYEDFVTLHAIDFANQTILSTYSDSFFGKLGNVRRDDLYSVYTTELPKSDSDTLAEGDKYVSAELYSALSTAKNNCKSAYNDNFNTIGNVRSAIKALGDASMNCILGELTYTEVAPTENVVAEFKNGTTWKGNNGNGNITISGDEIDITHSGASAMTLVAVTGLNLVANKKYKLIADEYTESGAASKEPYVLCYLSSDDSTTPTSIATVGNVEISSITNAINEGSSASYGQISISDGYTSDNRSNNFTLGYQFKPLSDVKMAWLVIRQSSSVTITETKTFHFKNLRIIEVE